MSAFMVHYVEEREGLSNHYKIEATSAEVACAILLQLFPGRGSFQLIEVEQNDNIVLESPQ